jgi:hypothetical protein
MPILLEDKMNQFIFLVVKSTQSRKVHPKDISACFGLFQEAVQDALVKNATHHRGSTWIIEKVPVEGTLKDALMKTSEQYISEHVEII